MKALVLPEMHGQFGRSSMRRIRWLLLMAILIIVGFMLIDLTMIPPEVHNSYIKNRLLFQVPIAALMFLTTWVITSRRFLEKWFAGSVIALTFLNYVFIYYCWVTTGFAFPYEGTFIYSLFLIIIIGIHARVALWVAIINSCSFILLMILFPVYDEKSLSSAGFVVVALMLACIARYQIDSLLSRLDRTNSRLESLSSTDELTGLLNRRALMDRAEQKLAMVRRQGNQIALFMVDIDNFKCLNDSYGHQKGDSMIAEQAIMLKTVFQRDVDVIGRYGGEEFLVVATDLDRPNAIAKGQEIVQKWHEFNAVSGPQAPKVTCSVGVCHSDLLRHDSLETLIGIADDALYRSKNGGRDQVSLASGT
jgi:diguanylate cyclase (GGDEF)-like protein